MQTSQSVLRGLFFASNLCEFIICFRELSDVDLWPYFFLMKQHRFAARMYFSTCVPEAADLPAVHEQSYTEKRPLWNSTEKLWLFFVHWRQMSRNEAKPPTVAGQLPWQKTWLLSASHFSLFALLTQQRTLGNEKRCSFFEAWCDAYIYIYIVICKAFAFWQYCVSVYHKHYNMFRNDLNVNH